jgi:hypothetical protein
MNIINSLLNEMISYYEGDPKRIQHFIKVHSFSKLIGELENLDPKTQFTLEISAIVHDIGIKIAEEKYGHCNGKLQEQEGPKVAEPILQKLNLDPTIITRVLYLIAHHHTYNAIDGIDYQILIEADFLVNLYENNATIKASSAAYNNIFKTKSGKEICKSMFLLGH